MNDYIKTIVTHYCAGDIKYSFRIYKEAIKHHNVNDVLLAIYEKLHSDRFYRSFLQDMLFHYSDVTGG